mgnify:CR=1 FL=1
MKNQTKDQPVVRVLPKHMKPIGEKLAEMHIKNLGLNLHSPEAQEMIEEYEFNFNDEAYGLSMTPSGLIGRNPSTPKVQEDYFNLTDKIFGRDGFIEKLDTTDQNKMKYRRVLRGNVVSLVHFILESLYDVKIKGKNGQISDFQYKEDANLSERESTLFNQYARLYYTVEVIKKIEEIIFGDHLKLDTVLTDIFGEEWKNNSVAFLSPKKTREEFVTKLYLGEVSAPSVKQNPSRVTKKENPSGHTDKTYFASEVQSHFDRYMIDMISDKHRDNTIQLQPSENYIHSRLAEDHEIKNADLSEPIVIGTLLFNKKRTHFLIKGEAQILKAIKYGIPTIDAILLSIEETFNCLYRIK